jgi:hypothetical protein
MPLPGQTTAAIIEQAPRQAAAGYAQWLGKTVRPCRRTVAIRWG